MSFEQPAEERKMLLEIRRSYAFGFFKKYFRCEGTVVDVEEQRKKFEKED